MISQRAHLKRGNSLASFVRISGSEQGVSLVSAAIVLPLVLILIFILVELGRILMAYALVREVVGQTLKFAASKDPYAVGVNPELLVYGPDDSVDIAARRGQFWRREQGLFGRRGKTYFTSREKRVFNLAYGFLRELDGSVRFPIPEPANGIDPYLDLGGRTNCSIYFRFAPDDQWRTSQLAALPERYSSNVPPQEFPDEYSGDYEVFMSAERNRIYTVSCRVPLLGPRFLRNFLGHDFVTVESSGYAYRSGGILRDF